MGNSPSTQDPSHSNKKEHGYHLHEAFNKDRQGSITSQLFNSRKSTHKRHASHASDHNGAIPPRMQLLASHDSSSNGDGSINNDNTIDSVPSPLFKKDYSLSAVADANDTTLASLSLNDDHDEGAPEEQVKSPSLLSPGPSMATVKQTKSDLDDLSTLNYTMVDETTEDERNNNSHHERHRSSIIALKKNLLENSATASPSPTRSSSVHSASLPPLIKTDSIDIPVRQPYAKKPSVHAYQYQYLNTDSKFSESLQIDKEKNSDSVDAEAGVLQSEDMVLNQSLLQNALKKDMQRLSRVNSSNSMYATERLSHSNNNGDSENNIRNKGNSGGSNDDFTAPISATAKMMMKLYGDKTLMERDLNKHENKTKKAQNKKLRSASNSRRSSFASLHSLQSRKSVLPNALNLQPLHPLHPIINDNESQYSAPQHREISHHFNSMSSMSSISSTNSTENTLVVLKWKDDGNVAATTEVSIVSNDIASALKEQRELSLDENASLDSEKQLNPKIRMVYDDVHKEWFVPDLFLPAGIYRLQFSINGLLTHSNFLPTATDSEGNFVNWFEVLPGYHTIEPFRNEADMESQIKLTSDEESPKRPELKRLSSSSRKSSYYSAKGVERPSTPFSDYRGLSRSNSINMRGSFVRLKASSLDLMAEVKPEKLEYSNEIPNLFNIGDGPTASAKGDFDDLPPQDRPSFTHKVVDCNQDDLFSTLQQGGNIDAETAEAVFLSRYPVPDLPIYLNSSYLNRILNQSNQNSESHDRDEGAINHIIPHVNLNHLLTSSIRDEIISVACTTRYEGKFITQVIYAPCYYKTQKSQGNNHNFNSQ
ncbi:Sip1p [Saccharomyces paradoxus]|uniref:Sip1p n=1 Tax=Saccharomyces paradoxus TaxID=27291 RepID=A0A8B8UPQ3_SACPA|nr:Sip1 [Saccharomyces paradoxus]QHS72609.1 Sip1 [Saccharomyces paradoxus]